VYQLVNINVYIKMHGATIKMTTPILKYENVHLLTAFFKHAVWLHRSY